MSQLALGEAPDAIYDLTPESLHSILLKSYARLRIVTSIRDLPWPRFICKHIRAENGAVWNCGIKLIVTTLIMIVTSLQAGDNGAAEH